MRARVWIPAVVLLAGIAWLLLRPGADPDQNPGVVAAHPSLPVEPAESAPVRGRTEEVIPRDPVPTSRSEPVERTSPVPAPAASAPDSRHLQIRDDRHEALRKWFTSPDRDRPDVVAIAQLCRRYGLEPWAVAPLHDFAFMMTLARTPFGEGGILPPDADELFHEWRLSVHLGELETRVGLTPDPRLVDELLAMDVRESLRWVWGPRGPDEPLLDGTTWEDLPGITFPPRPAP